MLMEHGLNFSNYSWLKFLDHLVGAANTYVKNFQFDEREAQFAPQEILFYINISVSSHKALSTFRIRVPVPSFKIWEASFKIS